MRTEVYSYSPRPGRQILVVADDEADDSCIFGVSGDTAGMVISAPIPDRDVPEVALGILAAMHEAAGLPVPIVLDRVPEEIFSARIHINDRGRVVADAPMPMDFEGARRFAAALAAAVERAEDGPDPAEVEALAEVIRSELVAGTHAAQTPARAVLAAGYKPPEKP